MQTNLERLNQLLQSEDLPAFRKTVGQSLNNLKWLKTRLRTENEEIKRLLALDPKKIHEPYEDPKSS